MNPSLRLPLPDRTAAGRELADGLAHLRGRDDLLVLALPRGGVPVADEVARALQAPLDLMLVRKLGVPGNREVAMGAIASGGVMVENPRVMDYLRGLPGMARRMQQVIDEERAELARRERAYRGDRPWPDLRGRCVILVDDGLATGATMRAAIEAVRAQQPACIVVAVPVAPPDTVAELRGLVDEVVVPHQPEPFMAIGQWYRDFGQVPDEAVREILGRHWQQAG